MCMLHAYDMHLILHRDAMYFLLPSPAWVEGTVLSLCVCACVCVCVCACACVCVCVSLFKFNYYLIILINKLQVINSII